MKQMLKFAASIFLIIVVSFASCEKDPFPQRGIINLPPAPVADTLTGKEFLFKDLAWVYDMFLYTSVEDRSDLFSNSSRPVEVNLRLENDTTWINVQKNTSAGNSDNYTYAIFFGSLFVFPAPGLSSQLEGTKVSINVKFL